MAKCPLLNKECIREKCEWWTVSQMRNVHTQEVYTESKCAIATLPSMLVELIRKTDSVGAAVESDRNAKADSRENFLNLLPQLMSKRIGE